MADPAPSPADDLAALAVHWTQMQVQHAQLIEQLSVYDFRVAEATRDAAVAHFEAALDALIRAHRRVQLTPKGA